MVDCGFAVGVQAQDIIFFLVILLQFIAGGNSKVVSATVLSFSVYDFMTCVSGDVVWRFTTKRADSSWAVKQGIPQRRGSPVRVVV